MITNNFSAVYTPGRNVSIDEAMVPFKGRSSLKQYMPKKPIKRGFKIWMAVDAENGFVTNLEVHTGKKEGSIEKGLGSSVVQSLTKAFHSTYRHIYFDNFFSSVDLLLDLCRVGLYGCGTLRMNRRGFPEQLKQVQRMASKPEVKAKPTNMVT